jgi:large subunit ribosomal protein L5
MSLLKKQYLDNVRPKLQEKFGYRNVMLIPSVKKIVISMGIAEAAKDKNAIEACINELTALSGQHPIKTRSRKAISNFKLREGQIIGLKVTLRGKRMYDFLYRFSHIVCPRIRDFRGLPAKCDGRGNYSIGLTDQQIFPEINLDHVKRTQGMNITFVTSAQTDPEALELLLQLGLPIKTN